VSFVIFNLVGSLLIQLFGLVVLLRLSSLLVSPLFLLEREYISNEIFYASTDGQNLQWRRKISKMNMADLWMARSDDTAVGLLARRLVTAIKIHSVMRPKVR